MGKPLKLEVLLGAIDKATGPLKKITQGSGATAQALKASRDELRHLERAQKDMRAFRQLKQQSNASADALKAQQEEVSRLSREIGQAEGSTVQLTRARDKAIRQARKLKEQYEGEREQLHNLRGTMTRVDGVTGRFSDQQSELTRRIRATNDQLVQQQTELREVARRQKAANEAASRYQGNMDRAGAMQGAGTSAMLGGAAAGLPILKMATDFASFEDAMLGVAKQVDGARDANGELTQTYYDIAAGIKAISERIPMATTDLARLAEGGARMGVEGKKNLLAFTETVAITATAFELPADQLGEDMGKIANLYKIPIANIQALGDAINYLDDNAQSQGGDIIDVMKRVAGVASTVNMSFRDASALGSTFLSLGAGREVAGTASSAMIRELAIAKMQPARFQQGLEAIGMSAAAIQAAMPKDATGTILKVLEAVNKLPDAKQLEVMTQLFGKEYGDDAAKLAKNVGEYRRQLELANSAAAEGSMLREADARNAALSAQWQITLNHLFNESSTLGALLKSTLVELMHTFNGLLESVGEFTKAHPELVKWLLKGAGALAALVAVGGAITLTLSSLLGPIAAVRYALFLLSLNPASLTIMAIVAAAVALAGAAYAIYANWGSISAWFSDRWADIKAAFDGGIGSITRLLANWSPLGLLYRGITAALSALGVEIPEQFKTLGSAIIDGLIGGLGAKMTALKDKVVGIADSVGGWFKDKLGINSPSRVFMGFGVNTLEGYQQGLKAQEAGPLKQIGAFSQRLKRAGAGIAIGATAAMPAVADIPIDRRPAMTATAPATPVGGDTITINVYGSPGMDERTLAQEVGRILEQRDREKAARRRSSLRDID